MEKICIKCNECKDASLFVKGTNRCKICMKIYKKEYAEKNKEVLKDKSIKYYENNKEKIKDRMYNHYYNDKNSKLEYQKKYYENNKEKVSKYKKEYTELNREKITKYKSDYQKNRRKNDTIFKLKFTISNLVRNSFKRKDFSKCKKTMDILGCDIQTFKLYLESLFTNEMSWENYGTFWDIDHKIPLATAKSEDDVIRLNHYTNLQPLNSYINRVVKKDKVDFS